MGGTGYAYGLMGRSMYGAGDVGGWYIIPVAGSYNGAPVAAGATAYISGGGYSGTTDGSIILTGRSNRMSLLFRYLSSMSRKQGDV